MTEFDSPIEKLLAAALFAELAARPAPISIHPQAPIGKYRADFLLQFGARRVVAECDGHDFHERTPEQAQHDKTRDRFFAAQGLVVLRFTGRELTRDAQRCAREVLSVLGYEPARRPRADDRAALERSQRRKRLAQNLAPRLKAADDAHALRAIERAARRKQLAARLSESPR